MAHKAVALYWTVKDGDGWKLRPVIGGPVPLLEGSYYLSYNDGERHMEPLEPDPQHALKMAKIKRLELELVATGGQVRRIEDLNKPVEPQAQPEPAADIKTVQKAVE
jgi:hypothetical protein